MSKHRILVFTGLWIMILPFLGFPRGLKNTLFVLTGSALILLAYAFKRRRRIQRLRKNEERIQSTTEGEGSDDQQSESNFKLSEE